jgi:hypothetical protein
MSTADTIAVIALVLSALSALATIGLYVMRNTSKDEASEAVAPLKEKMDDHEGRLIKIEAQCGGCPTGRDLNKLYVQLERMGGDVKAMSVEIKALHESQERTEKAVQLLNETMLSR